MEETKICSRCGAERPITEYRANQNGYRVSYRRECYNKQCAEYGRKNKEKVAARVAKWHKEHPGRGNERSRRHKEANREKVNERRRELHKLNPEQRNSVKRAWRAINRTEENRKAREARNRDYHKDVDATRAGRRAWYAANKDYAKSLQHSWRVRKKGVTSKRYASSALLVILKAQKGKCAYCNKDIRKCFEVDHIKPVAKGGHNGNRNIQLTCSHHNRSKGAKDPIDFARSLGLLL